MRRHVFRLFLLLVVVVSFTRVKAQDAATCNGSFGDPVVNEDFGSGKPDQHQLADGITNLAYYDYDNLPDNNSCSNIPDGYYIISNQAPKCYDGWLNVLHDHTYDTNGDPNGNMMIINATESPSLFFQQKIDGQLCPNTTYEFSAYILNLDVEGPGVGKPDIVFSIRDETTGAVIKQLDTQSIDFTTDPDGWVQYELTFTTGNASNIILEMTNNAPGGNGNDLALDDIQFRACGPLIQTGFNSITNNQTQNTCVGKAATYTLVSQAVDGGYANPKYQWQEKTGDTWADIPGATNATLAVNIPANEPVGTYLYRLATAEGDNINAPNCRIFANELTINVNGYPGVPTISTLPACQDEPLTLTATAADAVSFLWSGPGVTADKQNQNPLTFLKADVATDNGAYTVTAYSAGNCPTISAPANVTITAKPVVSISNTANICRGSSAQLQASAPGNNIYSWAPATSLDNPNASNPVASPTDTTTYTVTVTNENGCSNTATVTVNVMPPPVVTVPSSPQIIVQGETIELDGKVKNADTYYWTSSIDHNIYKTLTLIASPAEDVTYTLHAESSLHCGIDSSSVFVRVYKKVTVPNTFSPNGDGVNDTWSIIGLVTYPQSTLKVFNRYGQAVYASTGYDKEWNGTYNNKALPTGTYYYVIDLKNGSPLISGWVFIVY